MSKISSGGGFKSSGGGGFKSSGGGGFKGSSFSSGLKSSSGGGFKSSGGGFKSSSGGFRGSSGGSSSSSGSILRTGGTGSTKMSAAGMGFLLLILVILVAGYALLSVPLYMLFALLGVSIAGICAFGVLRKHVPTPEDKLREATIKEFPIPNTKEALLEFSILAVEKIRPVSPLAAMFSMEAKHQQWRNRLWLEKCESIYARAQIAMKDDKSSLAEVTRLMQKAGLTV